MDQIIAETLIASITIRHLHTDQIIKKCDFWFKPIEGYLVFRARLLTALRRPDIMGRSFGEPEKHIYQWHKETGTVILIDNSRNVKETTFDSLIKAAYLAKKKSPNQNVQIDFEIHVAEDKSQQPSIPSVSDYSVNTDMPSDQRINQKSQEIKEYFANNLHLKMPGKRTLNYMAICRAREPDSAPFTIPTGRVFEELQKADDEELLRNSSLHSFKGTAGALANQMLPAPDSLHSFEDTDSILVRQLQDPQMPMFQIEDSLKETPEYVEVFCLIAGNRVAMKFDKQSLLAALQ